MATKPKAAKANTGTRPSKDPAKMEEIKKSLEANKDTYGFITKVSKETGVSAQTIKKIAIDLGYSVGKAKTKKVKKGDDIGDLESRSLMQEIAKKRTELKELVQKFLELKIA